MSDSQEGVMANRLVLHPPPVEDVIKQIKEEMGEDGQNLPAWAEAKLRASVEESCEQALLFRRDRAKAFENFLHRISVTETQKPEVLTLRRIWIFLRIVWRRIESAYPDPAATPSRLNWRTAWGLSGHFAQNS
ncbi:MAG: hypothetical protein WBL50_23170, partial [Candidatus Acidiferrum sp.]